MRHLPFDSTRCATGSAMRAVLVGLMWAALAPAGQASAQTTTHVDDPWCDESRSDRPTHCEVRETHLSTLDGVLAVDATPNGGIEVEAWDQPGVRVQAKVVARSSTADGARALAARVDVHVEPGRVDASGPSTNRGENWWVEFRLSVPRDLDLRLRSTNGGLSVGGVASSLDLRTTNGGIHLADVGGDVRARTTNGGIHVELRGDRWSGRGLDIETTNGGVNLEIPAVYHAHLETQTVNGRWSLDYPLVIRGRIGRHLTADLGDGGSPVRATTTNGSVRLTQR